MGGRDVDGGGAREGSGRGRGREERVFPARNPELTRGTRTVCERV